MLQQKQPWTFQQVDVCEFYLKKMCSNRYTCDILLEKKCVPVCMRVMMYLKKHVQMIMCLNYELITQFTYIACTCFLSSPGLSVEERSPQVLFEVVFEVFPCRVHLSCYGLLCG